GRRPLGEAISCPFALGVAAAGRLGEAISCPFALSVAAAGRGVEGCAASTSPVRAYAQRERKDAHERCNWESSLNKMRTKDAMGSPPSIGRRPKKNAGGCRRFSSMAVGRRSLDQEFLELAALLGLRRQPARLLAAAGPGFLAAGRVAVLRRDLAQAAALGGLACLAGGAGRGGRGLLRAGGLDAVQVLEGPAGALQELGDGGLHLVGGLALGQHLLALVGTGDQLGELPGVQAVDVDGHPEGFLIRGACRAAWKIAWRIGGD